MMRKYYLKRISIIGMLGILGGITGSYIAYEKHQGLIKEQEGEDVIWAYEEEKVEPQKDPIIAERGVDDETIINTKDENLHISGDVIYIEPKNSHDMIYIEPKNSNDVIYIESKEDIHIVYTE